MLKIGSCLPFYNARISKAFPFRLNIIYPFSSITYQIWYLKTKSEEKRKKREKKRTTAEEEENDDDVDEEQKKKTTTKKCAIVVSGICAECARKSRKMCFLVDFC